MPFELSPSSVTDEESLRRFAARLLEAWMRELERDRLPVRLPRRRGLMRSLPAMPFHLGPELFLQVSGRTRFVFPEETLCLEPGSLCVVPRGLPHRERVGPWRGPFANLVFMYRKEGVSLHLARERDGRPYVVMPVRLDGVDPVRLGGLFESLPEETEGAAGRGAVKGLLLAHLSLLLAGLEEPRALPPSTPPEPLKVIQARHTVMRNLARPELSVGWVARTLRTSPGYLSRRFRAATGGTLVSYIEAQRVSHAQKLLETTTLNVTEVARATGYDDPSYFARRFRRLAGTTPRAYRHGTERD